MISDFLITCSGANKDILQDCSTERSKFIGIGAAILITAILASISGSYFLTFVFTDKLTNKSSLAWYYLLGFAILWGFLIFNLDRSIIVSIKKTGNWKEELKQAWIRVVLAIFLGLVIATPIELRFFQTEINAKLEENLKLQLKQNREENIGIYAADIKLINQDLNKMEAEISAKERRRNQLYKDFKEEAEGTAGTFKTGKGPVFEEKKSEFDKIDNLYSKALEELKLKRQEKDALVKKINDMGIADEKVIGTINGPEAKIKALYQLSGVHWFFTALLILLEIVPIITKLMSKRGPYDDILERKEYEIFIEQQRIISDKNDEINNLLSEIKQLNKLKGQVRMKVEQSKLDAELKANQSLLEDIANKQATLAKVAIEQWYEDELHILKGSLNPLYTKTKQYKTQSNSPTPTFLEKRMKEDNTQDEIYYFFKNGKKQNNELEYTKNGTLYNVTWDYNIPNTEIQINLPSGVEIYQIEEITDDYVYFKTVSGVNVKLNNA